MINVFYDINQTVMECNSIISPIQREWKFQMLNAAGINDETILHDKLKKTNPYVQ